MIAFDLEVLALQIRTLHTLFANLDGRVSCMAGIALDGNQEAQLLTTILKHMVFAGNVATGVANALEDIQHAVPTMVGFDER